MWTEKGILANQRLPLLVDANHRRLRGSLPNPYLLRSEE